MEARCGVFPAGPGVSCGNYGMTMGDLFTDRQLVRCHLLRPCKRCDAAGTKRRPPSWALDDHSFARWRHWRYGYVEAVGVYLGFV